MSARSDALNKLKEIFKTLHNSRYYVKRGVVAWAGFDFQKYAHAVSIQVDEIAPWMPMPTMSLSIEMATLIPEMSTDPEIDDTTNEDMIDDCIEALNAWERLKMQNGDPYIIKMERLGVRAIEFHDATLRVQGIILTVNVST